MTDRYARQTIFVGIGADGQAQLQKARVLIVGCGALGGAVANVLVRGGVGFVRLIDRDTVDLSNLQRQTLFSEADIGKPKAVAAADALRRANNDVEIEALVAHFDADEAEAHIADVDLVLDGTDNFEARYLINDVCMKHGKAWIHGAVVGATGVTMTVAALPTSPCFRCAFPDPPPPGATPTCETAGIVGAVVEVVAGWMVAETFKLIVEKAEQPNAHRHNGLLPIDINTGILAFDVWRNRIDRLPIARDPRCPACALGRYDFLDADESASHVVTLCGRNAMQVRLRPTPTLDLSAIAARLAPAIGAPLIQNAMVLRFAADGHEVTLFGDGRAIISGTTDPSAARALYTHYIGL